MAIQLLLFSLAFFSLFCFIFYLCLCSTLPRFIAIIYNEIHGIKDFLSYLGVLVIAPAPTVAQLVAELSITPALEPVVLAKLNVRLDCLNF